MAARKEQSLVTGGHAWGNDRVRLGVSIRRLSELTGIPRGYLSMAERGRLVPTGEEYRKVMAALADKENAA
jgi:predicted transcriptional regulator